MKSHDQFFPVLDELDELDEAIHELRIHPDAANHAAEIQHLATRVAELRRRSDAWRQEIGTEAPKYLARTDEVAGQLDDENRG